MGAGLVRGRGDAVQCLAHLVLGFVLIAPVVIFGTMHMLAARHRRNRRRIQQIDPLHRIGRFQAASRQHRRAMGDLFAATLFLAASVASLGVLLSF